MGSSGGKEPGVRWEAGEAVEADIHAKQERRSAAAYLPQRTNRILHTKFVCISARVNADAAYTMFDM